MVLIIDGTLKQSKRRQIGFFFIGAEGLMSYDLIYMYHRLHKDNTSKRQRDTEINIPKFTLIFNRREPGFTKATSGC